MSDRLDTARILIVDDQEVNVRLLEAVLESVGYCNLASTTDARDVLAIYEEFDPDLILLDLHMPHLDGFQVVEQLQPLLLEAGYLPILVITADLTPAAKQRALASGVKDFLTKPFNATEVVLRIRNLLETRFLHEALRHQNRTLEHSVRERTQQLENTRNEILERLALAAEYRDDDTGQHIHRVGRLSARLAALLGLPESDVELIRRTAPLHDVGKIGISDTVLLKRGRLTPKEFEQIKTHTTIGAGILSGSRHALLQMAAEIALSHHEQWNGGGYPRALEGTGIPEVGRIVAVADVFDALAHDRPYKGAWPMEKAVAEIESESGRRFDREVVRAFSELARQDGFAESMIQVGDTGCGD